MRLDRGRNSRCDPLGEPPQRAPGRGAAAIASASSLERSSRSVGELRRGGRSARASSARTRPGRRVGLLVLEQLDEAAEREDRRAQLVRGVGDELLAGAVEARQALLHLVEGPRELADLVGRVDRDRRLEVAIRDLLGGGLEPAQPARVRPRREPSARPARPGSRSRRRSGSGAGSARRCRRHRERSTESTVTQLGSPAANAGDRGLPRCARRRPARPRARHLAARGRRRGAG